MKKILPIFLCSTILQAITLQKEEAIKIGQKIWQNECKGTRLGLTWWKKDEPYASIGIGHFLWYPSDVNRTIADLFPSLLTFLKQHGRPIPDGILEPDTVTCPWKTREAFFQQLHSPTMQRLREYLVSTIDLQTQFIVNRLELGFDRILAKLKTPEEKSHVKKQFYRVLKSPGGAYPLIDYINFKGEGIARLNYNGHRWGLLQVLQGMNGSAPGPQAVKEFADSARHVLEQRVANAPAAQQKTERKWLLGWYKRIDTYLH